MDADLTLSTLMVVTGVSFENVPVAITKVSLTTNESPVKATHIHLGGLDTKENTESSTVISLLPDLRSKYPVESVLLTKLCFEITCPEILLITRTGGPPIPEVPMKKLLISLLYGG